MNSSRSIRFGPAGGRVWSAATAAVTDVFGRAWTATRQDGRIRLPAGADPLFVEAR